MRVQVRRMVQQYNHIPCCQAANADQPYSAATGSHCAKSYGRDRSCGGDGQTARNEEQIQVKGPFFKCWMYVHRQRHSGPKGLKGSHLLGGITVANQRKKYYDQFKGKARTSVSYYIELMFPSGPSSHANRAELQPVTASRRRQFALI